MPIKSGAGMDLDVSSAVITNADDIKILNTGTHQPNITNTEEENKRNELKSSPTVPSDQRKNSLTNSFDSNNVSIVTLDENAEDSSIIDSDDDCEDVLSPSEMRTTATNGIVLVNGNGSSSSAPGVIGSHEHDAPKLNIGSIAVQNSSGITFGNKTFYQGPVTIKQFLYDNNKWKSAEQGNDNPAFASDNSTTNLDRPPSNETGASLNKDVELNESKKKWYFDRQNILIAISGTVVFLLFLAVFLAKKVNSFTESSPGTVKPSIGDGDDSRYNIPINSSIEEDIITNPLGPLRFVTRSEWIAQPPENPLTPLVLPSTRIIIAHTATENCSTQAACSFRVRTIQTYHIESRHWDDIAYNFLVGGDGCVYEARGWDSQGAHTKGYNVKSIGLAFIGTFNKIVPPQRQLYAAQNIIKEGVKLKKVDPKYRLYGHRQLIPSESPGSALYEIIKTWPHWSEEIV